MTVLGTFIMLATYTLFYIMTVYSMTFSTGAAPNGLGLPRNEVLWMLMMAVIGFGDGACRRPAGGRFLVVARA